MTPRTTQQNNVVEMKNHTLQKMARTMLNEKKTYQNTFGLKLLTPLAILSVEFWLVERELKLVTGFGKIEFPMLVNLRFLSANVLF